MMEKSNGIPMNDSYSFFSEVNMYVRVRVHFILYARIGDNWNSEQSGVWALHKHDWYEATSHNIVINWTAS